MNPSNLNCTNYFVVHPIFIEINTLTKTFHISTIYGYSNIRKELVEKYGTRASLLVGILGGLQKNFFIEDDNLMNWISSTYITTNTPNLAWTVHTSTQAIPVPYQVTLTERINQQHIKWIQSI